jgi:hypothetical protein
MVTQSQINRSIYIIKPEAMRYRARIRKAICAVGLTVVRRSKVRLPPAVLDRLYPESTLDLKTATYMFMGQAESEVGEVVGDQQPFQFLSHNRYVL